MMSSAADGAPPSSPVSAPAAASSRNCQFPLPSASVSRNTCGSMATKRCTTIRPFSNGNNKNSARTLLARTMSGCEAQVAFANATSWASIDGMGSNLMRRSPLTRSSRPVASSMMSEMVPRYSLGSTRLMKSALPATSTSTSARAPMSNFVQSRMSPTPQTENQEGRSSLAGRP